MGTVAKRRTYLLLFCNSPIFTISIKKWSYKMYNSDFNYDNLSDEELIELSASGDRRATETVLARYKNLVKSKAGTYYLAGADRDDIIQEGMIGLFKAIRDFDITKQPSFKSFAELCIKRNMISAVRSSTRKKHSPLNSYISLSEPLYDDNADRTLSELFAKSAVSDPEEVYLRREKTEMLNRTIENSLSNLEKAVLSLHLSGLSYTDIAKELNRSPKSIDNALQRIKRKLDNASDNDNI